MPKDTIKLTDKGQTLMVAHQGLFAAERGNSLPAFYDAAKRTHIGSECDIHVTADKKIVVNHDDDIGSTCDRPMVIEQSNFADIREARIKSIYDIQYKGDEMRIPTMAEYIEACRSGDKYCIIELKNRFETADIKMVIEELKALNYLEKVIFISFNLQNCIDIREMLPEQPIQYLIGAMNKTIMENIDQYNLDIDMHYHYCSAAVIKDVHAHGHKINVWTIDDPVHAQYFISWGVDYITTNFLE